MSRGLNEARAAMQMWKPEASQNELQAAPYRYHFPYEWSQGSEIEDSIIDGLHLAALPPGDRLSGLTESLRTATKSARVRSARMLGLFGPNAADAVPALIDALDDDTRDLLFEFRSTTSQVEDLNAYNDQLEKLVATQRVEVADYERQFQEIEITKRRILPLIVRMIEVLEEFVSLDIPYLETERGMRIAELKKLMARPEVPTSEKYRRVTEAYQIDVMDADVHALLGDVFSRQQRYRQAVQEYATAVELSPDQVDWQVALADACVHEGDLHRAGKIIEELLRKHPEHQAARTLLDEIRPQPEP